MDDISDNTNKVFFVGEWGGCYVIKLNKTASDFVISVDKHDDLPRR